MLCPYIFEQFILKVANWTLAQVWTKLCGTFHTFHRVRGNWITQASRDPADPSYEKHTQAVAADASCELSPLYSVHTCMFVLIIYLQAPHNIIVIALELVLVSNWSWPSFPGTFWMKLLAFGKPIKTGMTEARSHIHVYTFYPIASLSLKDIG